MSGKKAGKARWVVAALVVLVGAGAAWWALRDAGPDYVQFTNGFEFPVTAQITDEGGSTTTLEIPPTGRVSADLDGGQYTVEFISPQGTMKKKKYKFAERSKRKERCMVFVNVLGSAAIVEEDVVYGVGIKGGGKLTSGHDLVKLCPRWGFETTAPPEAIKVKDDTVGMNLTWMHYVGEGDWYAAIESLLAKKPRMGDQSRIRAWNLAVAVSKHDPDNERLARLGPEFQAACHKIVDTFTTGPLAGKAKQDCLRNTQALFSSL